MLPGAKISKVFASRWHALYWSGGVLLLAYCTIPAAEPEKPSGPDAVPEQTAPKYDKWDKANRNRPVQLHKK